MRSAAYFLFRRWGCEMKYGIQELKRTIMESALDELKDLSRSWHNMDPRHETPERNRHNVDVCEYGGYAGACLIPPGVKLYDLDELIAELEEDMGV